MARKKIQGITIELNGDTTKLQDALKGVENKLKDTQDALKDTQRLLKLDPGNVELLKQKQGQLTDAISATEEKLKILKDASEQAAEAMASGDEKAAREYDALQREIIETEQQMKSLKNQLKDFGSVAAQQIAAAGEKVKDLGDKMQKAGTAMTKYVTGPIVAVGAASVAAFNDVDAGLDIIVKKTGATGKALEGMEEAAKNLATSIPTDFATAGTAIGEVNTRFGLTGDALESLAGKFIKFADLNNTDVSSSIDTVQSAMAAFGLDVSKAGNVLDILNKAAQDTGADVNKLAGDLVANAAAFQEMGFRINGAAGFLANLDKAGLDASTVMTGLKKALQNATKNGQSMDAALKSLTGKIKNVKSETKAMQIATELFGGKAAPAMVKAIRDGRLSFDELANAVEKTGGSVERTFEETLDPLDEFKLALNELKIVGMELVEAAAPLIKSLAEGLKNAVSGLRAAWEGLSPQMQETIIKMAGVAAAVGPVLTVGGKLVSGIGSLMGLAPKLVSAFGTVKTALSALWGVMAANPITLIIAAIGALVGAFIYCWNNVEGFKEFFLNAWEAIKQGVSNAAEWIKNAIQDIGNWFADLGKNALNWGRDLVTNFIDGIKQMWENAKRTVRDFAGMIKDFLGFSEPKEGPLSNFHTYAPDMVKLFAQGLKDNRQLVANQLAQTFALPEQTGAAVQTATGGAVREFTAPINGGQAGSQTAVLMLDGQVVGRVIYPRIRDEQIRLGVQLSR